MIFTSNYVLHCLLFFNSSVDSQGSLVEDSRPIAKQFKGKVPVQDQDTGKVSVS